MCSRLAIRSLALVLFLGAATVAAEGDAARGEVLAYTCKGCHALDSYSNVYPTYHVPRIGGQSAEYLVAALTSYRSGNREHSTMQAQAASYSDQDLQDIAAYVASVTPALTAGEPRGTYPAAAQTCKACHGETGVGQISSYPYLAGQREDYLLQALNQYKTGQRTGANATVMQAQLMTLSEDDLAEIAAYYADQDGLQVLPID